MAALLGAEKVRNLLREERGRLTSAVHAGVQSERTRRAQVILVASCLKRQPVLGIPIPNVVNEVAPSEQYSV